MGYIFIKKRKEKKKKYGLYEYHIYMWSLAFQQPYHNMWSFFSIKSVTTNLKFEREI